GGRGGDRAAPGGAAPPRGGRPAVRPARGGGPPYHAADGDHVRHDRRPHLAQAAPEEGGHAGAVGGDGYRPEQVRPSRVGEEGGGVGDVRKQESGQARDEAPFDEDVGDEGEGQAGGEAITVGSLRS